MNLQEQTELRERLQKLLYDLADGAVAAGRTNWDSYYGYDNSYHLMGLEDWPAYKEILNLFGKVTHDKP